MHQWHDFLAMVGTAGVLTGLVFVAVSINLQEIVSEPGSGLPGRAAEALILLVGVLTASVLLLVPGQGQLMVGAEVLVVGLVTWGSSRTACPCVGTSATTCSNPCPITPASPASASATAS